MCANFIDVMCRSDVDCRNVTSEVGIFILQLIMADARQGKIFVTRDEGVSFVGHTLPFTPNRLSFQSQRTPNVLEGTIPEHVIGYDQTSQEVYMGPE